MALDLIAEAGQRRREGLIDQRVDRVGQVAHPDHQIRLPPLGAEHRAIRQQVGRAAGLDLDDIALEQTRGVQLGHAVTRHRPAILDPKRGAKAGQARMTGSGIGGRWRAVSGACLGLGTAFGKDGRDPFHQSDDITLLDDLNPDIQPIGIQKIRIHAISAPKKTRQQKGQELR